MNYYGHNYYDSIKLMDNLHCYIWQGRGNNCNSCLFTNVLGGNKPHLIIDPGHTEDELGEQCFNYLTTSIEKDGFSIDDIGLIINTHSHADHCQANPVIVQKSKSKIALSKEEDEFRHTGGKILDSMFGIKSTSFDVDLYLKEGSFESHDSPQIDLQILFTPGHSPGSICIYWPSQKILITGDVVFYGSIGRTDFPGSSDFQMRGSLKKLVCLPDSFLVNPGHGPETTLGVEKQVNPFLCDL